MHRYEDSMLEQAMAHEREVKAVEQRAKRQRSSLSGAVRYAIVLQDGHDPHAIKLVHELSVDAVLEHHAKRTKQKLPDLRAIDVDSGEHLNADDVLEAAE